MQSSITAWLNKQPKSVPDANLADEKGPARSNGVEAPVAGDRVKPYGSAEGESSKPLHFRPPLGPDHALPATAALVPCTLSNIEGFTRLNALLLPIPYPPRFYDETVNDAVIASITRLAVWDADIASETKAITASPKIVAAIRCRIIRGPADHQTESDRAVLYISTIGTLAPFRGHGLATHLLAQAIKNGMNQHGVRSIMAHVWEANEEGLEWYRRRGFRIKQREEGYYRRLAPKSAAIVVVKDILPSDILYAR